jgi:hypothetical protein
MTEYADAKRALERLHRELMELNPTAARSLEEGMEETLTVHRLRVPAQLRRTLASTNVIESAFSIVETICRNVKRWRAGDHIERWIGSGLLVAERQFRKVQYAADFNNNKIDVYDGTFTYVKSFTDPKIPKGFVVFNVQDIGKLYVAYVSASGGGGGYIDIFSEGWHADKAVYSWGAAEPALGICRGSEEFRSAEQYPADLQQHECGDPSTASISPPGRL